MTLTEFLKARIDEDEAAAKRNAAAWDEAADWVRYEWDDVPDGIAELYGRFGSARVLREVEAKRAIIAEAGAVQRLMNVTGNPEDHYRTWLLTHMASVYSDHPDYAAAVSG